MHACEVYGSLTGHNVKSRAHFNRIEYCYIHDSSNREFDLVDDTENTGAAGSDSVLLGNLIVKGSNVPGNRNVIHFGQDGGGDHKGKIYLVNNTIVTKYISPVVALDAPNAGAVFTNNIVYDTGTFQSSQKLVEVSNGATLVNVDGSHNWLSVGFGKPVYLDGATTWVGFAGQSLPFNDALNGDYTLYGVLANLTDAGLDWATDLAALPATPGHTPSVHESVPMCFGRIDALDLMESARPHFGPTDLGAYEYVP